VILNILSKNRLKIFLVMMLIGGCSLIVYLRHVNAEIDVVAPNGYVGNDVLIIGDSLRINFEFVTSANDRNGYLAKISVSTIGDDDNIARMSQNLVLRKRVATYLGSSNVTELFRIGEKDSEYAPLIAIYEMNSLGSYVANFSVYFSDNIKNLKFRKCKIRMSDFGLQTGSVEFDLRKLKSNYKKLELR